jgi:hypothetical protein
LTKEDKFCIIKVKKDIKMTINELFNDDDGEFMGTPRSKFFDIVFNANRNLVEQEIEDLIERMCLLEMIAEEAVENIDQKLMELKFTKSEELEAKKVDTFINSMGNILTQNE